MQSVAARVAGNGDVLDKSVNGHFASEPEVAGNSEACEEEAEEEDEDEEEEEPSLKYERIAGAIPDLLKKDAASALAIVNKKMVRV
jgi:hypothetical protein